MNREEELDWLIQGLNKLTNNYFYLFDGVITDKVSGKQFRVKYDDVAQEYVCYLSLLHIESK